eukprot:TRINITY_DN421_c0_g1_i1.p1 TRINITY_DN421_c0_g1~~TRINITY_DN421_c0_g1_i1.p1  ORF type:complete len:119 (+),score=1.56 TRINITY_DN421_c0_g1_i1:108-464(+)
MRLVDEIKLLHFADEARVGSQLVEPGIRFALGADVARESESGVLSWDGDTVLVEVGNVDLHASVVLGGQDARSGRALAGDVHINVLAFFVLHGQKTCYQARLPKFEAKEQYGSPCTLR